ncbi:MAG: hypothetical protein ACXVBN_07005 [Flavisolibacter sp.]
MKHEVFSLLILLCLGEVACQGNHPAGATEDSSYSSTTIRETSRGDYAAMSGEFERNSAAGRYRDLRTGAPIHITVDPFSGQKTRGLSKDPVTRYIFVDDPDWWVYDNEGNRLGRAKMENNQLLFEDSNNTWVNYEVKWKNDGEESKMKTEGLKVKTTKDGALKIKTADSVIKKDAAGKILKEKG